MSKNVRAVLETETGLEELRIIGNMLDCCTESSCDGYTLEQLVAICRAWRQSEWDIPVQGWTVRQRREGLRGIPPQWDDKERPVYAQPKPRRKAA
jgi:hypothetical protein